MGRVCSQPHCPRLAVDRRYCEQHKRQRQKLKRHQRSDEGKQAQALFRTKRWKKRRDQQIAEQPYCQCPVHAGRHVLASELGGAIADHVEPHHGEPGKFWHGKLQTLGKWCHDSWKQRTEHEQA